VPSLPPSRTLTCGPRTCWLGWKPNGGA